MRHAFVALCILILCGADVSPPQTQIPEPITTREQAAAALEQAWEALLAEDTERALVLAEAVAAFDPHLVLTRDGVAYLEPGAVLSRVYLRKQDYEKANVWLETALTDIPSASALVSLLMESRRRLTVAGKPPSSPMITMNGQYFASDPSLPAPRFQDGRTIVGLQDFGQKLGFEVSWVPEINFAFIKGNDKLIGFTPGLAKMLVDGHLQDCYVAPFTENDHIMVPLVPLAEALGGNFGWNEGSRWTDVFVPTPPPPQDAAKPDEATPPPDQTQSAPAPTEPERAE